MTGIEKITSRILDDARADADAAVAAAEEAARQLIAQAEEEAAAMRTAADLSAAREAEARMRRAESEAQTCRRERLLRVRGELIDSVFSEAEKKVRALGAEDYRAFLAALLCEALASVREGDSPDGRAYLLLNTADAGLYGEALLSDPAVAAAAKAAGLTLSTDERESSASRDIAGGLILRTGDIEVNCTLAAAVADARERYEGEVCTLLFGGQTE